MKSFFLSSFLFLALISNAQSSISGIIHSSDSTVISMGTVAIFSKADTSLIKVETTDEKGMFIIGNLESGKYFVKSVYVGFPDMIIDNVELKENQDKDLGNLYFVIEALDVVEVVTNRAIVEVKPDRIVFNVSGTINSTGSNALSLLRKAPSVNVDNNDNISVLGRSGVNVYVDGKRLPLAGDDLSNYLKNLPADQIDKIDIISTPGAKYDAEGNAGIIDIRLKKDKNLGANGSLSATYTQGQLSRYNLNGSGNYRNKNMNIFGGVGYGVNDNFHNIRFNSYQNDLFLKEINNTRTNNDQLSYRLGTDFFVSKKSTIGFLYSGGNTVKEEESYNDIEMSKQSEIENVDSILVADNRGNGSGSQNAINLNYAFYGENGRTLNLDVDYGQYNNQNERMQPNLYYNAGRDTIYSQVANSFITPRDIQIYTAKADFETEWLKGVFGIGAKVGRVLTKNTFEVFNEIDGESVINNLKSNQFDYEENVYAGYLSYSRSLGEKWKMISGLRVEQTDAVGNLTAYDQSLAEVPVNLNYLNWFPSAGITWDVKPMNSLSLNYGRRINRPDYNVLNPFRNQLSELSFEKGNPYLKPEIVNNIELGYTFMYMFNFKLGYSKTVDKITRLIGPDDTKPQAGFISWDNLATQEVWSFNASLPMKFSKWWSSYTNASLSFIDNQADYGEGAVVNVQALSYMIYQQHTFKLPKGFTGEVSGYYSGPGIWGGTFVYDANWSLAAGLQKRFLKDKLKARVSVNNIFNRVGWRGESTFNGLVSNGYGSFDNRYVSLSLNYDFGNKNVKSRKRKTGLESESDRVK